MRAISIHHVSGTRVRLNGKTLWKWRISEFYVRERSDGTYTWTRVSRVSTDLKGHEAHSNEMPETLLKIAKEYANTVNIAFVPGIYSGLTANLAPVEMLTVPSRKFNK